MNPPSEQTPAPADVEPTPPRPGAKICRHIVSAVVRIIVITYVAWLIVLFFSQNGMLFPVNMTPAAPAAMPYPGAEILTVQTDQGSVPAYLVHPPQSPGNTDTRLPVVIFFHGNAEIIDYQNDMLDLYHDLGFAVLLPEYRGYGRAAGSPSQQAIVADVVRFYDQLTEQPNIDPSRIYYHGRSIGGGVATQLAAQRKPRGLILQSTFKSIAAMSWRYAAPPLIVTNPFRSDRILQHADYPVLIFHGSQDRVVPVDHGRALHQTIPDGYSQYVEYPCGHNDFPGGNSNHIDYADHIKIFLDTNK